MQNPASGRSFGLVGSKYPSFSSIFCLVLSFVVVCPGAPARATPADLCLTAARQAAVESGVPLSVLVAITQVETGRSREGHFDPWPWTVNLEGEGRWFDTPQDALDFARSALLENRQSFDTGCFQINYRWHSDQFSDLQSMFDPTTNARYAARYLSQLYSETGDWSKAAGAYHSRTEEYANQYRARFDVLWAAAIAGGADQDLRVADTSDLSGQHSSQLNQAMRVNSFPLLMAQDGSRSAGSLVPLGLGG